MFGCLFSEEDNTVDVGEIVSLSIISVSSDTYSTPSKVYVNGKYKIDIEEVFFSLTFDEPGIYNVTVDNSEMLSLNEISIEVIKPKSYNIHLRIESPRDTLFDDSIGTEPITVTVKDEKNVLQGQYYLSDTVLNPIVNALDNSGIVYEIDNAQGFSFRLLSQYPRTEDEGWHYLINNEPTLGTASLEKLNDGDNILWYYGRANSEPLFIYYNNTPIKENKAMPNDIILTVMGLNSTISNAKVYVDGELYGTTDKAGNIELSLSGGRYSIKAQKKGMINSKDDIINIMYEAIYIVFYALIGVMSIIIISTLINQIYKKYKR